MAQDSNMILNGKANQIGQKAFVVNKFSQCYEINKNNCAESFKNKKPFNLLDFALSSKDFVKSRVRGCEKEIISKFLNIFEDR
jgi:hypothetical protein